MRDRGSGGVLCARGGALIEYQAYSELSFRSTEAGCGGGVSIS
jgi:hypothetical protein